jgi:hypothetical protein
LASVSQVALTVAQDTQAGLVTQQLAFGEVRDVQNTIATVKAGQKVGASTEINLRDYLADLQQTLPAGVTLDTVQISTGTPMVAYGQSDVPLQGARVGEIVFTASSATLPTIPDWLRGLEDLPGYVDATPGSVRLEDGIYKAEVTMHINAEAFSQRFDPEHMAEEEAAAATTAKSDGTVKAMTPAEADTADGSTTDEGGK